MKTKLICIAFLITFTSIAQTGINYKALIKDANGNVISNQSITLQFSILEASTVIYEETHNLTTTQNGLAVTNIGEGTVISGDFDAIDWASDDHFLNVQVDTGSGLTDLGTTKFMAVPYALSSGDHPWTKNENGTHSLENNIGINIENPEYLFDVRSMSPSEAAQFNISNSDKSRYVRFFSGSDAFPNPSMTWAPGNSLLFATFNDNTFDFQEKMQISALGDVGIGITNPEAKLDIKGGDWNLDAGNPGDLRIGNTTHNFRIGIATGGGGAGITRMYTNSNTLIIGANDTPSLRLETNGEIKAPELNNSKIESAGSKSLITKEYADATYKLNEPTTKEIMFPAASFSTLGLGNYVVFSGIAQGESPLIVSVVLPVGATITELNAYFYDSTANNMDCSFKVKNINTNSISSFYTISTSNTINGHQVITSTAPIQITSNFAYFISVQPSPGSAWSGADGLKGVKIVYTE